MAKRQARQATAAKPLKLHETVTPVAYGSPEHEQLISIGYDGLTVAQAKQIVAERKEKPELWPWEEYMKAQAVIAAHAAKPIVVSTRVGWKRGR